MKSEAARVGASCREGTPPGLLNYIWLLAVATAVLLVPSRLCALEFSTVTNSGHRLTVCVAKWPVDELRLFLRDDGGRPLKSFEATEKGLAVRRQQLLFAMNAGMYRPDLSPVGLYVEEGREVSPLNLAAGDGNFFLKPNGVFAVTRGGPRIVESSDYSSLSGPIRLATQSGPLLVLGGKIHPQFNPASASRLIRNGVGVRSTNEVLFVISEEPVTFHEFAILFRDQLGCRDALYLDGVISSLHAPPLKRSDRKVDLGPIIGVVR